MRNALGTVGVLVLGLAGCAAQRPSTEPLAPPPPSEPPAAALPPAATEPAPEPPKPPELTAEQKLQRFRDCWAAFNAKDMTQLGACYAEGAVAEIVDSGAPAAAGRNAILAKAIQPLFAAFPDASGEPLLTLMNGDQIVSVVSVRGTHQGTLETPRGEIAATNKKTALTVAHAIDFAGGSVQRLDEYTDQKTLLVQLGVLPGAARKATAPEAGDRPVITATNNDTERVNVETFQKLVAAFNQHDAAAYEALLAEDIVLSEAYAAADRVGRKEVMRGHKELWKGISDAKIQHTSLWGAGDYVVAMGTFSGTNDGPLPSMKLWNKTGKTITLRSLEIAKLESGKVKKHWVFANGLAMAEQLGTLPPEKKPAAAKSAPTTNTSAAKPAPAAAPPKSNAASPPSTPPAAAPKAAPPATPTPPAAQ